MGREGETIYAERINRHMEQLLGLEPEFLSPTDQARHDMDRMAHRIRNMDKMPSQFDIELARTWDYLNRREQDLWVLDLATRVYKWRHENGSNGS